MRVLETEPDSKIALIPFFQDGVLFKVLGVRLNDDFAVVAPTRTNKWLLILRRPGIILEESISVQACIYLAMVLGQSRIDLDSQDALNAILSVIHSDVSEAVGSIAALLDSRSEMLQSGDLSGLDGKD